MFPIYMQVYFQLIYRYFSNVYASKFPTSMQVYVSNISYMQVYVYNLYAGMFSTSMQVYVSNISYMQVYAYNLYAGMFPTYMQVYFITYLICRYRFPISMQVYVSNSYVGIYIQLIYKYVFNILYTCMFPTYMQVYISNLYAGMFSMFLTYSVTAAFDLSIISRCDTTD